MKFLLDTNVLSELRKPRPHGAVRAWYEAHPASAFAIPSVVFYELQAGVEMTRRQDRAKASEIERWIDSIEQEATVVPLDAKGARETARLMHGRSPDLTEDAMIAAIARTHHLTVATRNLRDFEPFDVPLFDPFTYRG